MATGTLTTFDSFWEKLLDGSIDLAADTIRCALVEATYVPDRTTHDFFNDITNEAAGAGYTAGGVALSGKAVTQDNVNDRAAWTANDASWAGATVTFRYAILYKDTGVAGTSALIAYIDFGANLVYSAQTVTVDFAADGILTIGGTLTGDFQAFNSFYKKLGDADFNLGTDVLKLALVTSSWTPDIDAQDFWDDVQPYEASGAGYTADGATLGGQATTTDTVNHRAVLDANDVTWAAATVTFRYVVLYQQTGGSGSAANDALIGYWDLGLDRVFTATDVAVAFASGGIFAVGA